MDLKSILNDAIAELNESSNTPLEEMNINLIRDALTAGNSAKKKLLLNAVAGKDARNTRSIYDIVDDAAKNAGTVDDAVKNAGSIGSQLNGFKDAMKAGYNAAREAVNSGINNIKSHPYTYAGAGAGSSGIVGLGIMDYQNMKEQEAAEIEAARQEAARQKDIELANRTPLEKLRDMGVEGYEKAKAALSGAYDDVAAKVQEHPYMAAAIPGALLAGAGALALRRRQMAAKNQ